MIRASLHHLTTRAPHHNAPLLRSQVQSTSGYIKVSYAGCKPQSSMPDHRPGTGVMAHPNGIHPSDPLDRKRRSPPKRPPGAKPLPSGLEPKVQLEPKALRLNLNYERLQRSGSGLTAVPTRKGRWWIAVTSTRNHTTPYHKKVTGVSICAKM